jgi:hypothetical protein
LKALAALGGTGRGGCFANAVLIGEPGAPEAA